MMGDQSAGSIEWGCRSLEYGTLPDDDSELFVVCGRCDFIDDVDEVPTGLDFCDEAFSTVPTDDYIADASGVVPSHPADEAGRSRNAKSHDDNNHDEPQSIDVLDDDFTLDGPAVITAGTADCVPEEQRSHALSGHTVTVEPLTRDAEGWPMPPGAETGSHLPVTPVMVSPTDPAWQALVDRQISHVLLSISHISLILPSQSSHDFCEFHTVFLTTNHDFHARQSSSDLIGNASNVHDREFVSDLDFLMRFQHNSVNIL